MWICRQCQQENADGAVFCPRCGGPRAAGRFSASAARREKVFRPAKAAPAYKAPDTGVTARRLRGRFVRGVARWTGGILCVLLPILTAVLAVTQYAVLCETLTPLFTGSEAADWLRAGVYGLLALSAVLLSLLPGLWTLLLARPRD